MPNLGAEGFARPLLDTFMARSIIYPQCVKVLGFITRYDKRILDLDLIIPALILLVLLLALEAC